MEQRELVSVIIPTFNRDIYYISKAIKSVMHQTYKNYEIIVVDDNLFKSYYSMQIKKYCSSHNIKYLKTRGQEGANKARNIGACHSKGKYLAFLDDDDMWLPDKLNMQLKCFTNDIALVYTNGYVITPSSKYLYSKSENFVSEGNLYKLFLYNYIGPTVSALIKKDCFFNVGMFDENMPSKQDYDLWIRITKKYEIIGIKQPLFLYTQHNSYQMTKDYNLIFKGYQMLYIKNRDYIKNDFILRFFFYLKIALLFKYQKRYFKYYQYVFFAFKNILNAPLKIIF